MANAGTQRDLAREVLCERGIVRPREFKAAGVNAATVSRMVRDGEVRQLARGLYQLPDAQIEALHTTAEAAKRVPKGVVCLVSALSFHELTDQIPPSTWMAIGKNDWAPKDRYPPIKFVRFADAFLKYDVMTVNVESVDVKVFGVGKTVADCFRNHRTVSLTVAIEGLQEALRQRKATPAEIARHARRGGVWTVMQPYLLALTANE